MGFTSRPGILNGLALFYGIIAFILILFILVSGNSSSMIQGFYYLKTDTSDFRIPSNLANATFLREISEVSGIDLVGSDATTSSSLGLADEYTVSLLSSCGIYPGNEVSCSSPEIGYAFEPEEDLNLSSTGLTLSSIFSYAKLSRFLGGAYIVSSVLIILAPITSFLTGRWPRAAIFGVILATVTAILLTAASIAAVVVFPRTRDSYNDHLRDAGIVTHVGKNSFIATWVATVFAFLCAITLMVRARAAKYASFGRSSGGSAGGRGLKGFLITGSGHDDTKGLITGQESIAFTKLRESGSDEGTEMHPVRPKWQDEQDRHKHSPSAYEPYSSHA